MLSQTLTTAEQKHISSSFIHRRYVHRRSDLILSGFVLLSAGCWFVAPAIGWMMPIRDWFLVLELAPAFFIFAGDFVPCKCGQNPILSNQERLNVLKGERRSVSLLLIRLAMLLPFGLVIGAVLAALVIGIFKLLLPVIGFSATVFLLGSPIFTAGFIAFGSGVLDRELPWIKSISRREYEEISNLADDSVDSLQRLIEFSLRIGEFTTADAYSVKLFKLAESRSSEQC